MVDYTGTDEGVQPHSQSNMYRTFKDKGQYQRLNVYGNKEPSGFGSGIVVVVCAFTEIGNDASGYVQKEQP
jgi:hypothetical protein